MAVSLIVTGGDVHLSGNPIEVTVTATAAKTNHKLAVKVSCAALLSPVQIEEIEPTNLVAIHQINGLVNEPLPSTFDYPAIGKVGAREALALIVTVDCGEVWDDENGDRQESWQGVNQVIRIINGQLRDYELAILNDAGKSFASEYITGGKFLTNLPNHQKVTNGQTVKLWYLSRWMVNHPCQLNFTVETDDGIVHDPLTEAVVLIASGLFEFSMNPGFIGFVPDPGVLVTGYTFWLSDETGDISERRHFVVDNDYYETQYFGFYRNEYSAIESFWLHGKSAKTNLKTESEMAYKPVQVGSGTKEGTLKTVSSSGKRFWEINTGVRNTKEMIALRELLESEEIWLVDQADDTRLIPVNIPGNDFLLDDPMQDNIQSLEIAFHESNQK